MTGSDNFNRVTLHDGGQKSNAGHGVVSIKDG
jgi:hypothetical protein